MKLGLPIPSASAIRWTLICLLLMSAVASSMPLQERPNSHGDDDSWTLIMNDGHTDFQVPLSALGTRTTEEYIHAAGMKSSAPWEKKQDPSAADSVAVMAWREDGAIKIKLEAMMMKWEASQSRPQTFSGDPTRIAIGTYSLAPDQESLVVKDGAKYKIPDLRFSLSYTRYRCLARTEDIRNLTASLKVEGIERLPGYFDCSLLLRNAGSKHVTFVALGRLADDGATLSLTSESVVSIPAGKVGKVNGNPHQVGITLAVCLFDDGTYEGDGRLAMRVIGGRLGSDFEMEKFTALLKEVMRRSDDDSQLIADLQEQVRGLPNSDSTFEEATVSRLNPQYPEELRTHIRRGIFTANRDIAIQIDDYLKKRSMPGDTISFRKYWQAFLIPGTIGSPRNSWSRTVK